MDDAEVAPVGRVAGQRHHLGAVEIVGLEVAIDPLAQLEAFRRPLVGRRHSESGSARTAPSCARRRIVRWYRAPRGTRTPSVTTHSSSTQVGRDVNIVPQNRPRHARRGIDAHAPARGDVRCTRCGRERPRRRPVVRHGADVPERRVADESADRARLVGDQGVVDAADRVGRLSSGQRGEDAGTDDLDADEVVGVPSAAAPRGANPITRRSASSRTPP